MQRGKNEREEVEEGRRKPARERAGKKKEGNGDYWKGEAAHKVPHCVARRTICMASERGSQSRALTAHAGGGESGGRTRRTTCLARPLGHLLRLGATELRAARLEQVADPRRAERLLELPVGERLGEVAQEADCGPKDGLGAVLVGQGKVEEGEDVGDVGEEEVGLAARLEPADDAGVRLEDALAQRVDVVDEVVVVLRERARQDCAVEGGRDRERERDAQGRRA